MADLTQTPTSSMFSGYSYDEAAWILTLHLKNGKIYEYLDLGPEEFDEFKSAKSLGTHYNTKIKGVFDSREVTKVPTGEPVKEQLRKSVEDDLGITDDDIRLAHPDYEPAPKVPESAARTAAGIQRVAEAASGVPTEPEILSPEQAAAVLAPRNSKVDELVARAHALAGKVIHVSDKASQADMETHLVNLQTVRKALFDLIDPYREIAYRAYEAVQQLNKSRLTPIDNALASGKRSLSIFLTAERERAAELQRKLDAEARAKADEEQRQRTEALRLEAAEQKAAAGDTEGAELSLFDQNIQAPPVYTPPARVEEPKSTLGGRANWKAEVVDFDEVILDVAAGIMALREKGNLQGHAPSSILKVNDPGLKALATANKSMFRFPGMRCWDDRSVVVKTAKE